ncbi:MAG: ArnT family glycosyltransferase [Anaerolineales bacterium]
MKSQATFWLVIVAALFAAVTRWVGALTLPPQAWVDEIWFALRARDIVQTGEWPIFYKTFWGGVNPMLAWLTAGAQWLAFSDLIVSSRVISTTFSVLCVPLAFACFREMWREFPSPGPPFLRQGGGARGGGLSAALIALVLAGFFSVITLSRLGTEPALALAASFFCVWQLKRAERLGNWLPFALAGAGAGWAQYVSPHARFILPLMALLSLHTLWMITPTQRRKFFGGYALTALVAVIVALPIIAFFVREPEWFLGRARAVTVGAQQDPINFLLGNTRALALSFSFFGDANPRDNLALRPLLDWLQSLGFYLGLGWALLNLRPQVTLRPHARELLLWLAVMLVPPLITDNAPSFSRLIMAAPPVIALIVIGWGWAWRQIAERWTPHAATVAACAWVAGSLLLNSYDYFVRYTAQPELHTAFTVTAVNVARDLTARAQTESVFVERSAEADEDVYAFDFLLTPTRVPRLDFRQCLPLVDEAPTRTIYVVLSERDRVTIPQLLHAYPAATVNVIPLEPESLARELTLVEVPAGTSAPAFALAANAEFAPGLRLLGHEQSTATARPGESVLFTFYWKAEAAVAEDLTPFLHVGTGLKDSRFVVGHDGAPCQGFYPTSRWRVGEVVPDRFAVVLPPDAVPGVYPLALGWYRYPSLNRLPLTEADDALPDNRAIIGTLVIAP